MSLRGEDSEGGRVKLHVCMCCCIYVWRVPRNWGSKEDISGDFEVVTPMNGEEIRNGLLFSPPEAYGLDHERKGT